MANHKFGIINQFKNDKMYCDYEPQRYNCISVDMRLMDYIIDNHIAELRKMKTFLSVSSNVFYGIDESGITIIPPESLKLFRNIIIDVNSKIKQTQLINLINKIDNAIEGNKYLIHFGI